MSLAAVGSGQHYNIPGGVPPAPSGLALQGYDYYSMHSWIALLLGGGLAWLQMLKLD